MRSRLVHVLFVALALVLAACGGGDDDPASTDDSTSDEQSVDGDDTPADDTDEPDTPPEDTDDERESDTDEAEFDAATCESAGVRIDYPRDWSIITGKDLPSCRVFHPEPLEWQNESLHYAVQLWVDAVRFADATGESVDEELDRREVTVDGRDAVRIERRSTGAGLLPEGEESTTYVVDLDGSVLVATTSTVGDTDYAGDVAVLDAMIATIDLDDDAS